jgi:uncharacterized RDD family membrane protein YckC
MKEIRNQRARDAQGRRAGFVSQAMGVVLDSAVIIALDVAALAAFGFVRFIVNDDDWEMPQPGPVLGVIILTVIGVALLWSAWSGSGRAPGMAVLGLRVVSRDGTRLSSRRAFWGAVIGVLTLGLGVGWVLVSKKNKSIYDIVCGTNVVYEWRPSLAETRQNQ